MDLAVELQNENDETQGLFFVLLSGLLSSCTAVVNTHVQPAKNSHFLGEKKAENKKDQFQFLLRKTTFCGRKMNRISCMCSFSDTRHFNFNFC